MPIFTSIGELRPAKAMTPAVPKFSTYPIILRIMKEKECPSCCDEHRSRRQGLPDLSIRISEDQQRHTGHRHYTDCGDHVLFDFLAPER